MSTTVDLTCRPVRMARMLVPDLAQTERQLTATAAAATAVTDDAQAAITLVPVVPNPPAWFAPIQSDLATAKGHARVWPAAICPLVTTGIPRGLREFNAAFQPSSERVLAIQQEIEAAGAPTAAQRTAVDGLLAGLSASLATQSDGVTSTLARLKAYLADLQADQDALQSDLGTVAERFASGATWIQQLTDALGESFVDSSVLGPCIAIVQIDLDISLKIAGVGADPTVLMLVMAKAILTSQIGNSGSAQLAVESILDTWATLAAKVAAVRADLHDAQADAYLPVLSALDMQTAREQCQQLADFASHLIGGRASARQDNNPPLTGKAATT